MVDDRVDGWMLRSKGFFAALSPQSQPGTSVDSFHLKEHRVAKRSCNDAYLVARGSPYVDALNDLSRNGFMPVESPSAWCSVLAVASLRSGSTLPSMIE